MNAMAALQRMIEVLCVILCHLFRVFFPQLKAVVFPSVCNGSFGTLRCSQLALKEVNFFPPSTGIGSRWNRTLFIWTETLQFVAQTDNVWEDNQSISRCLWEIISGGLVCELCFISFSCRQAGQQAVTAFISELESRLAFAGLCVGILTCEHHLDPHATKAALSRLSQMIAGSH